MPSSPRRIAAIDIGTNSIHMIVVESRRDGYRVIDREKKMVQLGRGSLEGKPLTDDAIERGVAAVKSMVDIARQWKADEIVGVATSAVREAPNRRRFITAVKRDAGISVRVISGEEEADYIYRAVRAAVDFHGGTALSIDIGGGSVELIVGTDREVYFTGSEPLGALRIAQKFSLEQQASAASIGACRSHVTRVARKTISRIETVGFDFTVGTSGTILTLAAIAVDATNGAEVSSGLRWLSRSRLSALIEVMAPLRPEERARRFALDPPRAQTILAGAVVLDQLMRLLGIERLRASDAALREGIIQRVLDRGANGRVSGSVRRSSVMELAKRSGIDRAHATRVARLALRIFDQLEPLHLLKTGERELLEYAANLHEIGMQVSYQGYHRHSYYLISHAGLKGFTGDQVAVVANAARYHRKSPPGPGDHNFVALSATQKAVVTKLSSILRVADALDRGRRGAVRDVALSLDDDRVEFRLRLRDDADLEIAAARRRAKHFERAFERKARFSTTGR